EGSGAAPAPSATTADLRADNGNTDTNNNAADFTAGTPNPRNTASAGSVVPALTATTLGNSWTWTITVTNGGNAPANFSNTHVVLADNLPNTGIGYTNLAVG